MNLSSAQLLTLKTWLVANANSLDDQQAADLLNQTANPDYWVFKTLVLIIEIGDKINGAELGGLTTANHTRLQTVVLLSAGGVNPSLSDRRAFFDDIFSGTGGTITRANLATLWRRLATTAEKLFATGAGTTAAPSTMGAGAEGKVTTQNVIDARNS